jgi:transcriptional regulator with XRE-family HTH domain
LTTGFSKKLSKLRREHRLSQKKVADDLGISQALLSHYENGIREPRLDFVVKICAYYGVTADYLLDRTDIRKNPLMSIEDMAYSIQERSGASIRRIIDSIIYIYTILADTGRTGLSDNLTAMLDIVLYRAIRSIALPNSADSAVFNIPGHVYSQLCQVAANSDEVSFIREILLAADTGRLGSISSGTASLPEETRQDLHNSLLETLRIAERHLTDLLPEK